MEDLNIEEIIKIGQRLFPEMSPEQIVGAFQQFREQLPQDMSNIEVAQIIRMTIEDLDKERSAPQPAMPSLRSKMGLSS